ncbi:hypothetical protein ABK040_005950 [Willaertia magna]
MPLKHFQVAVVGGGMVGNALANALAKSNYTKHLSIALINPFNPMINKNKNLGIRTSALTPISIKLLENLQKNEFHSIPMVQYKGMKVWDQSGNFLNLDLNENEIENLEFPSILPSNNLLSNFINIKEPLKNLFKSINETMIRQGVSISKSTKNNSTIGAMVDNNDVVLNLLEIAKKQESITLFDNTELKGISNNNLKKLNLEITNENGEKVKDEITCDLIIAADGANSFVRNSCNIPFYSKKFKQRALVTNVEVEGEGNEVFCYQQFLKDGPIAMLPTKKENVRNIIWSTEPSRCIEYENLYKNGKQKEVLQKMNEIFSKLKIVPKVKENYNYFPIGSFPLQRLHVSEYVLPNGVALVGDAAHCCHPMAGQGVNMGLVDVIQLVKAIQQCLKTGSSINDYTILKSEYERVQYQRNEMYLNGLDAIKMIFEAENYLPDFAKDIALPKLLRLIGMEVLNTNPLNLKQAIIGTAMAEDVDFSQMFDN